MMIVVHAPNWMRSPSTVAMPIADSRSAVRGPTPGAGGGSNTSFVVDRKIDLYMREVNGGPTIHQMAAQNGTANWQTIAGHLPVTIDGYSTVGTEIHKVGQTTGDGPGPRPAAGPRGRGVAWRRTPAIGRDRPAPP